MVRRLPLVRFFLHCQPPPPTTHVLRCCACCFAAAVSSTTMVVWLPSSPTTTSTMTRCFFFFGARASTATAHIELTIESGRFIDNDGSPPHHGPQQPARAAQPSLSSRPVVQGPRRRRLVSLAARPLDAAGRGMPARCGRSRQRSDGGCCCRVCRAGVEYSDHRQLPGLGRVCCAAGTQLLCRAPPGRTERI